MSLTLASTLRLRNGVDLPRLGLGVYQAKRGEETQSAVGLALRSGYRHIDTARIYGNEQDVGEAIRASGVPRSEIFVTTKLWNADQGYDAARVALDTSLRRLGLEQVDLYLIHWPVAKLRGDSWRALEGALADGKTRSIGVSNYTIRHLEELLGAAKTPPAVNQVELSPFLTQDDLRAFCRQHEIAIEAYSPLTQGKRLDDETLGSIARRHRRTPAQVLIRWCLQHDLVVLPKSATPARIAENASVYDFELTAADMTALDALDEGARYNWDPTNAP